MVWHLQQQGDSRSTYVAMFNSGELFIDSPCPVFYRYSDTTIEALEILDRDEKIDLDLILALIRYIVLNEEVSLAF